MVDSGYQHLRGDDKIWDVHSVLVHPIYIYRFSESCSTVSSQYSNSFITSLESPMIALLSNAPMIPCSSGRFSLLSISLYSDLRS